MVLVFLLILFSSSILERKEEILTATAKAKLPTAWSVDA